MKQYCQHLEENIWGEKQLTHMQLWRVSNYTGLEE